MGRHLKYRAGSFYRKDDRTGFPQRAERTRQQWDGLIVDKSVWEARQPQDLVRGTKDDQTVPQPRPLPPDAFVGPTYLQLTAAAAIGATVLHVNTTRGASAGLQVGVMTAIGEFFDTTLSGDPTATTITLAAPLPYPAQNENLIVLHNPNPGVDS